MRISRGESIDRYYLFEWRGWAVFLHHIHHSDPPDLFHSHPWDAVSVIGGQYTEERYGEKPIKRRGLHLLPAKTHHRVTIKKPVWTILIHASRSNVWSVLHRSGTVVAVEPWRGEEGRKDYSAGGK